ncbi:hypothetical protein SDC9_208548 [bioreactor metagenome]|uniref:Uncharacterized protein n=1 Tax=bioreactor metagenome TaxID=1076179 RepID=A0A645JBJ2_9ZZZZ
MRGYRTTPIIGGQGHKDQTGHTGGQQQPGEPGGLLVEALLPDVHKDHVEEGHGVSSGEHADAEQAHGGAKHRNRFVQVTQQMGSHTETHVAGITGGQ